MKKKESGNILIVGDGPKIKDIVAEQRALCKNKPLLAANGEEAFQAASKETRIDRLLIDIHLDNKHPVRETYGVDFANQFSKLYPKANVLFVIP